MTETTFWSAGQKKKLNIKIGKRFGIGAVALAITVSLLGLILFLFVLRPAFALLDSVNVLRDDISMAQASVIERDLVQLEAVLNKTDADLENLRQVRDRNFAWTQKFGPTSLYYKDSEHFINAGFHMIAAAREAIVVAEPFAAAGGFKVAPKPRNGEGEALEENLVIVDPSVPTDQGLMSAVSSWLAVMPVVADDLDTVLEKLELVGMELSEVDAQKYPEEFRGLVVRKNIIYAQTTFTQLSENAEDIKAAMKIIPGLMGVGTNEKRYMIIMQNDKELRATGGFWTYLSTFKLNNGELNSDFTSYNSYYIDYILDEIDKFHTFPKVPLSYQQYLKVERMYARDANISPDLPTSIDQFMKDFWLLAAQRRPAELKAVDGVITIDTVVLEELLEITGPVTVNGFTYNQDNVVLELEKIASLELREQLNRKKILGDMMEKMLINVFESDNNLWPVLVDKGIDLLGRKHIAVVMLTDPQAQELLEEYNLSNRIVDPVEGDYTYVVHTNLGGDKTNWFTDKQVTHEVSQEGTDLIRTVSVKYTYTRPSAQFDPFVKRFRDWVRVYVPAEAELIEIIGSEGTNGEGEERNKKYFSGYIELGPDETKEIVFKYRVDSSVAKPNGQYKLYLQKQSGVDTEKHIVVTPGETREIELIRDYKYTGNF